MQSVASIYPANVFKTVCLPTASVRPIQAKSSGENTPKSEQWDPPVDLTHVNDHQRQADVKRETSQMLREESESFSKSDNEIGCVKNLQMNI